MDLIEGEYSPTYDALGEEMTDEQIDNKLRCELSFYEFVKQSWESVVDQPLVLEPHVELQCRHLEAVARKDIKRLLINIPPGVGKSTILSVMWPAWVWTWWPEARFMFFSYAQKIILRDSTACRTLIESEWYQRNWGRQVAKGDQDQQLFFNNARGGWRMALLTCSGTGFHPDFICIDDPQDREGAKNENDRLKVKKWYFETIPSRGKTRGACHVVQQQRLDEDDLSGEILAFVKLHTGTKVALAWHHLNLPMHFDPKRAMPDRGHGGDWRTKTGELLAPNLLNAEAVEELELEVTQTDPGGAEAQLEQNPTKVSGDMFKIDRLKRIKRSEVPKMDKVVRYWDRAATQGAGCNTAGVLLGLRGEMVFILGCAADQWSVDNVYVQMSTCAIVDEADYGGVEFVEIGIEQEPGSGGVEAAENARRRLKAHRVEVKPPSGNKVARATPVANAIAFGEVYIVSDEPWYPPFIEELRKFPAGKKDRVDALSGGYLKLVGSSKQRKRTRVSGVSTSRTRLCLSPGCGRPVAGESDHCCVNCEAIASFNDGTVCSDHQGDCNLRNFEHEQR